MRNRESDAEQYVGCVCAGVGWGLVFRIWSSMSRVLASLHIVCTLTMCIIACTAPFLARLLWGTYVAVRLSARTNNFEAVQVYVPGRMEFGWPSGGTRVTLGWHLGVRTWPGWHAGGSRVALGRHWGGTRVAHGWPSGKRRPQARATSGSFSEPAWISPEGRGQCVLTAVPDLTGILFTRSRWQT